MTSHDSRPGDTSSWEPKPPTDPVAIGELVDGVLGGISQGTTGAVLRLRASWRDIAGTRAADRSSPVALDDGVLLVEVVDGATASLLRFESANMARRARDVCAEPVTAVRFRVRRRS